MTIAEALSRATRMLAKAGIDGAARDARALVAHVLGVEPGRLVLVGADPFPPEREAALDDALSARVRRQPVAQIVGRREFYGRSFEVTQDVLDPRPDTEAVVEACLAEPFDRVLDLGTGSGCILLTLLAERPQARGVGVDLSQPALAVAARNADALGVAGRVELLLSDWFGAVSGRFDLIVANPPYVSAGEMAGLEPEVRQWEPRVALTDEADGLGAYRRIVPEASGFLRSGGRLIVEIGHRQGGDVAKMFDNAGLSGVRTGQDLSGHDRFVEGRKA